MRNPLSPSLRAGALSLLVCSLVAPAAAAAKDRPMADHERALSVAALRLTSPMLLLDYEQALSDKTSFSVGAGYGRYNSLWLRFLNSLADDYGAALRIRQVAATGSYNYYFKGFNRGWYTGGTLEYDLFTPRSEGEDASYSVGSFSNLSVGPHIGYKIATEKGFTFSWDVGVAYQAGFGNVDAQDLLLGIAPGIATSRLAFVGVGSLNVGWSF